MKNYPYFLSLSEPLATLELEVDASHSAVCLAVDTDIVELTSVLGTDVFCFRDVKRKTEYPRIVEDLCYDGVDDRIITHFGTAYSRVRACHLAVKGWHLCGRRVLPSIHGDCNLCHLCLF